MLNGFEVCCVCVCREELKSKVEVADRGVRLFLIKQRG